MEFKNINNFLNFDSINNSNISNIENKARLIDPGVKYFFNNILKNCNNVKQKYYNLYYNFTLLGLFIIILAIILITRYKGKKNKKEQYLKSLKNKEYIMSKLVYYNKADIDNKQRLKNNMITNLPDYSNHPEASLLHRKIYF